MKTSNPNGEPVTHGELAFIKVDKLPRLSKKESGKYKMYIAGHSETGHHHIVESDTEFEVVLSGEERYMIIKDLAKLWHKKSIDIHETRILSPGIYKINEKTEYNPFTKLVTRVFD
jgi:hypothetical protein